MKTLSEIFKDVKIEGGMIKSTVKSLLPKIEEAKNEGYRITEIFKELEKRGLDTTINNFRVILTELKKGNKKKKNVILVANDKGGVGKTTITSLLNLPNSVIVNIDSTRIIKNIFPYKNIVDFYELKKAENIDLEDYIVSLIENSPFENIIIDTKGGLSEDLKLILKYVTAIVVPVKVGDLSEEASYEFIFAIKNYLDTIGRKVNWAIVYNEISPKFLKKIGVKKYDFVDLIKDSIDFLKEEILKDDLKVVTYLKRSESITTREIVKKDIDDLLKENFTAYLPIKEEVERLNKDLKVIL